MAENVTILFIFILLLIFGIIFFARVQKTSFAKKQDEKFQKQAIEVAEKVMFLPELQCSVDNVIQDSCIDILKAELLPNIIKSNQIYYSDFFERSNVSVEEIYPGTAEFVIYSNVPDDYTSKSVVFVPVTLYNAATDKNSFGVMSIEVYR